MRIALIAILVAAAISLAACGDGGGGEDLLGETGLRDCLADAGLGPGPAGEEAQGLAVLLSSAAPDFVAYSQDGTALAVVVQGSEKKAQRTAADVRASILNFGAEGGGSRVLSQRNAVLVFSEEPSEEARAAAESCLD